jgi:hypothetical protein
MKAKKRREFESACERIFKFFDSISDDGGTGNHPYHDEQPGLFDFLISNFLDPYPFLESVRIPDGLQDQTADGIMGFQRLSFCLGFVIGREVDIIIHDPTFKQDIETVTQTIREEGLLPYFPHKKKAA